MNQIESYLNQITKHLLTINPYRIILFGSAADSTATEPTDIDLLVILDINAVSQNYEEKMRNKLLVRQSIYDISKKIPIDLPYFPQVEITLLPYFFLQRDHFHSFQRIERICPSFLPISLPASAYSGCIAGKI